MELQDYRFLESASNVKAVLKKALDRTPNTTIATEIATCLQQGRMFFDTAKKSPLEIRPLLVQYGVIAMGKALVASRTLATMSTFTKSHGLSDVSTHDAKLEDLRTSVLGSGSFQEFNDTVRLLDFCTYYGDRNAPRRLFLEWGAASNLSGKSVTFDDVFSRLPWQSDSYEQTFDRPSNCLRTRFDVDPRGVPTVQVFLRGLPSINREQLKEVVARLRAEHDFLNRLVVSDATCSWGELYLSFAYLDLPVEGDTDEPNLIEKRDSLVRNELQPPVRDWQRDPPPMCGQLAIPSAGNVQSIRPLQGVQYSPYSIMYLAVFMLGSLVRYRPQTWVHAMTSRVTRERPSDDKSISLVESFLDSVLGMFPNIIMNGITIRREDT